MINGLQLLKSITSPFAVTSEHVQGPGGNTSYKRDGKILIKASGFTFNDVAHDTGVVLLNNQLIVDRLLTTINDQTKLENAPPNVLESTPAGLKPSMEFEFHSLLGNYVLHTHSVYVNVITCSSECSDILSNIFKADEYLLLPYVTPGFPIAAALLNSGSTKWPSIIFLKNHGIIIHGNNAEDVLSIYKQVQDRIMQHLHLTEMSELKCDMMKEDKSSIKCKDIADGSVNLDFIEEDLTSKILIPDQSIFFWNKISSDPGSEIFLDKLNNRLIIKGSQKFINAARAMLQAVYFIKNTISKLNLTPDYITQEKLDILHGLSTEKYRLTILKDK